MKKNGAIFLFGVALSFSMLAGCGGNGSSSSSSTSSSAKSVEAYRVVDAATLICGAASSYGYAGTASNLVLESKQTENDFVTASGMALMLKKAFSSSMPEKTGARRTMGTSYSMDDVSDVSSSHECYSAVSFLAQYGLLTLEGGSFFFPDELVSAEDIKTYLDRFYFYFGTRLQDDFYATINHDYLFEDPRWRNPTKPTIDTNDDGIDDEEYVYDNKIIPQSGINNWTKRIAKENNDSEPAQFLETYYDQTHRVSGDLCGLYPLAKSIIDSQSMYELDSILKTEYQQSGYFPLWRDLTLDCNNYIIEAIADNYSLSGLLDLYEKGGVKYLSTIDTFTTNFGNMYGLSKEDAKALATDFAVFKLNYLKARASYSEKEHTQFRPEKDKIYGQTGASSKGQTTGINLYEFIQSGGIEEPNRIMWSNYATIMPLLDMWNETNFKYFKAYLAYELGNRFWYCLPNEYAGGWFKIPENYGTTVELLEKDNAYEDGAFPFVHDDAIELYYTTKEYSDCVAQAVDVVSSSKNELRAMIQSETWLSQASKDYCFSKLDALKYSIGVSYFGEAVEIKVGNTIPTDYLSKDEGGTLFGNIRRYFDSKRDYFASYIGCGIGERHFVNYVYDYDPLTANAFYSPSFNTINITLGYLTSMKPITSMGNEEKLANYGWVIGHEISHGFDPNGIRYDAEGKYSSNPFSEEEKAEYDRRADTIATFYDGYEVMPDMELSGDITLTEDVADVTGVRMSLNAAKKISGFDYEKYFTCGADVWGGIITRYLYESYGYMTNVHPYGRARLNRCFSAMDEFHDTYQTKNGDGMYAEKEKRPSLW